MYARHDLIWLTTAGWSAKLAAHAAPVGTQPRAAAPVAAASARAALALWRERDWPLIVRRREPDAPDGAVCAGLAAPPDRASGAKLRLPLQIDARYIARHERPLPLQAVLAALPPTWRAQFAALAADAASYDIRVYGSLSMQALTGQPYLRPGSDIDLVFRPTSAQQLDAGLALLAAHSAQLPLDGEIVFPSGQAVAWKEWHAAQASAARVLVKAHATVNLRAPGALRAELELA